MLAKAGQTKRADVHESTELDPAQASTLADGRKRAQRASVQFAAVLDRHVVVNLGTMDPAALTYAAIPPESRARPDNRLAANPRGPIE